MPDDVKLVITGFEVALDVPGYITVTSGSTSVYSSVIDYFEFDLTNYSMSLVGVSSDSSVYNVAPFVMTMLAAILVHILVSIVSKT